MQNKTLLAKIVGLVAVMCLALAMVFGLVGCGGKTVSKTSIENGHLIVTYSDNTTEDLGSVIGPKGDKGDQGEQGKVNPCEHVNKFLMNRVTLEDYNWMVGNNEDEIEATGEDFCYFELYVCKDCGFVTVEFETEHDFEETEVAPTCEEEGYTGLVCTVCGYAIDKTDIVPATGHDYETNYYTQYLDSNKSFCIDGGFVAAICATCGDELDEATFVEGLGHQSLNWRVTVNPTTETEGELTGICDVCGKAVATRVLPKLDKDVYNYHLNNEERADADSDYDKYAYSITIKYEEYTFDAEAGAFVKSVKLDEDGEEIAQTFDFTELQPHVSNGVEYVGKKYIDNYEVGMDGIMLFGNSGDLRCDAYIPAYFVCDECGEAITVNVKKAHKAPESDNDYYDIIPAGCEADGVRYFTCTECGEEYIQEVIPALGHDYQYEIVPIENSTKVNIKITCSRCEDAAVIENVTVTTESEDATCEADGYIKYSYTPDGATEPTVLTKVLAQLDHRFVDEENEIDIRLDDAVIYPYGLYNFTPFGNVELGCGDSADMYFTCADCGKPILVHVIKEHVMPADYEPENLPTCTEEGVNEFICAVCGNPVEYIIPALGHDLDIVHVEPGTEEGKLNVTIGCSRCQEQATYENCTYVEKVTKVATCTEPGKKDIIITAGEGTYTIPDIVIGKLAHTYNNANIDEVNAYPYDFEGLTITGNNPENCQGTGKGIIWCDVCKKPILVYVKGPHTIVANTLVEHEATCTEDAWREFDCALCQAALGEEYEKIVEVFEGTKLGHDYVYVVDVKPTATATGVATVTCTRCEEFAEEVVLPVLDDDNYVIDPEALCNAEGLGTYTVEIVLEANGDKVIITFTNDIPTTAHHWVDGAVRTFTYTDEEEITWTYTAKLCADCGEWVIVDIVPDMA